MASSQAYVQGEGNNELSQIIMKDVVGEEDKEMRAAIVHSLFSANGGRVMLFTNKSSCLAVLTICFFVSLWLGYDSWVLT